MTRDTIHGPAGASSLGLLRILVFGTWAAIPLLERLPNLSDLPVAAFAGPGPLALLPDTLTRGLLSAGSLWLITGLMSVSCLIVASGLVPDRRITWFAVAIVVLEQGIVRGFSGHINHAELALLYVTVTLALFPVYDGLARNRAKVTSSGSHYRAAFLVAMVIFTFTFAFVGVSRLSEGPALFQTDTLYNLLLRQPLASADLASGNVDLPFYLSSEARPMVRFGYVLTTFAEALAPLALLTRRTRIAFVWFALAFHVVNLLLLGVTFYENIVLLSIFSERWFHRVANWLEGNPALRRLFRMEASPGSETRSSFA